jgi:heme exporter protein C
MWKWIHRWGAPERCYQVCQSMAPFFAIIFLAFFSLALVWGLFLSPPDYQQGDAFRIMYLHVPAAIMSMGVYVLMAAAVIGYFVWKIQVADWLAQIAAPLGAIMTLITLVTGSLWGRPTWGTYWIWDARLTSELILLFIYLGIIAMRQSIPDKRLAGKASGIVVCVGLVNLPIIHYSVTWWHTLHQGASLLQFARPSIAPTMLKPLLLMIVAYVALVGYCLCARLAATILTEKSQARWVQERYGKTKSKEMNR